MDTPIKIWMGTTDLEDLSGGWISASQMTLVFDGTLTFPGGENDITIPLQTPFAYTNGNLVIMFKRPLDTDYYLTTDYFKAQTIGATRARNARSDSVDYDPEVPPNGTLRTIPKTTFLMTPLSDQPTFNIHPETADLGTVLIDT